MGIVLDAGTDTAKHIIGNEYNEKEYNDSKKSSIPTKRILQDVYIPEKEIELLKEVYSKSVVQDFGDMFHYTKEEREKFIAEHTKLHELRKKRFKCPRLAEYVKRWRTCLEIVDEMADKNGIIQPDEFKKKAIKGDIVIGGLKFPKYTGKKKKSVNWDFVMDYILDKSKDPDALDEMMLDKDVDEDEIKNLPLSKRIDRIADMYDPMSDDEVAIRMSKPSNLIPEVLSSKQIKEMKKDAPEITKAINNEINLSAKRERARMHGFTRSIEEDDFDYISRYDKRNKFINEPEFKGDILDDNAFEDYLDACDEYERETTLIEYNGKLYTPDQMDTLELKVLLESNGWDLRKVFIDKDRIRKEKRQKKKDAKREKQIKQLLNDIQNRKERRDEKLNGLPQGINVEEYKKKMKKKNKKDKHKKSKKKFENILMDATAEKRYKNLKAYRDEMEDFSWKK